MTRIPVHSVDSAPEGSRDAFKALEAEFGKVLNIHGAMAHSSAVLGTYAAVQRAPQDTGTFAARTREAIALAVANVDDCFYCQAPHTARGKAAGLSQQKMIDIRRGQVGRAQAWSPPPAGPPRRPSRARRGGAQRGRRGTDEAEQDQSGQGAGDRPRRRFEVGQRLGEHRPPLR
jgi:AhpD family alkylhydroperoxidase